MASINGYTRKFVGRLGEDNIRDIHKRLDYSIENTKDRISLVEEIVKNEFFTEYFNVCDKSSIDHNVEVMGLNDRLDELKENKTILIKHGNMLLMEYKRTKNMELVDKNTKIQAKIAEYEEEIDEINHKITQLHKKKPERIYFNVHPRGYSETYAGDALSMDNNVCQTLEKIADYILKTDAEYRPQSERQKKKINYYENSLDDAMARGVDYDYDEEKYKGNYKLEIKQKIYKEDFAKTKVDKNRNDVNHMTHRRETLKQMQQAVDELIKIREKNNGQKYFIDKAIGELNYDMLLAKDAYNGTIYFKKVVKDTCDMQEWLIDFREVSHIKALLECTPSSMKWYGSTSFSLEQYLHDIRHKISKEDWDDLQFVRECSNISYNKLIEETGYSRDKINAALLRISKLVYKHHMDISQDLWYLNVVCGSYKKCSRCYEIKLTKLFNKDANRQDGLFVYCKECEKSLKTK